MSTRNIERALKAHFSPDELDWRVQSSGVTKDGKPWARCLCYVDARCVQDRLDLVLGWDAWQTRYSVHPDGIICRLTVTLPDGSEVSKEDGSPETAVEAWKGGLSKAFVRVAASGYGVGRYLYNLGESWAQIVTERPSRADAHAFKQAKIGDMHCWWLPPALPEWAHPSADDAALLAAFADANDRFGVEVAKA